MFYTTCIFKARYIKKRCLNFDKFSFSVKYTDYKASWPPEPIGHNKPWKAGSRSSQLNQNQLSRPPPGLASQKQPMPSPWSGGAPRLSARGWSSGSSGKSSTLFPHVYQETKACHVSNCTLKSQAWPAYLAWMQHRESSSRN